MRRNWKRVLSLWLTLCMVFTMNFGFGATAVYATLKKNVALTVTHSAKTASDIGDDTKVKDAFTLEVTGEPENSGDSSTATADSEYEETLTYNYTLADGTTGTDGDKLLRALRPGSNVTRTAAIKGKDGTDYTIDGADGDGDNNDSVLTVTDTFTVADNVVYDPTLEDASVDYGDLSSAGDLQTKFTIGKDSDDSDTDISNITIGSWDVKKLDESGAESDVNSITGSATGSTTIKSIYTNGKAGRYKITAGISITNSNKYPVPILKDGETSISATLTLGAPGAVTVGDGWSFKYKGGDVNEEQASYTTGTLTLADTNFGTDEFSLKANELAKNLIIAAGGSGTKATINVSAATDPAQITMGASNIKLKADSDTTIFVYKDSNSGKPKYEVAAVPGGEVAATNNAVYVIAKVVPGNTNDVEVLGNEFKITDSNFKITNSDRDNVTTDDTTGYSKLKDATSTEPTTVSAIDLGDAGDDEKGSAVSFKIQNSPVKITLGGANLTKDTNFTLKESDDSLTFTIKKGVLGYNPSSRYGAGYKAHIISVNGTSGARYLTESSSFNVTDESKDVEIKFEGLMPSQEYQELTISTNSIVSENGIIVLQNVAKDNGSTEYKTKAKAPTAKEVLIDDPEKIKATSFTVSSNKDGEIAVIAVSANSQEVADKVIENVTAANSTGVYKITTGKTGITFNASNKVLKSEDTSALALADGVLPGKTYYIYAAYYSTDTLTSDIKYIGTVTTKVKTTINPVLSVKNFDYLGKQIAISGNITAVSSPSATKGKVVVKAILKDKYDNTKSVDDNFDNDVNNNGIARDVNEKSYGTSGIEAYGWISGDYIAIARYVPEDGDDTLVAGPTVSANFKISQKTLYLQPVINDFNSISTNLALGTKYSKIGYKLIDEKGNTQNGAFSDIEYVVDGKVISSTTEFSEAGEKKVYARATTNSSLTIEGDNEANFKVVDMTKFATFQVVALGKLNVKRTNVPLYYEAYKSIINSAGQKDEAERQLKNYVTAVMEGQDITNLVELKWRYYDVSEEKYYNSTSVPKNLGAGDYIYVGAAYDGNNDDDFDDDEDVKSETYIGVKIEKQPVQVIGTDAVESYRFDDVYGYYDLGKSITVYPISFNGKVIEEEDAITGGTFTTVNAISKLSGNLIVDGIDSNVPGDYKEVRLTFDSASMNDAFKNYTVDNELSYLETYKVKGAYKIQFISASDGSELADAQVVKGDDVTSVAIAIDKDSQPNKWTVKWANDKDAKNDVVNGSEYNTTTNKLTLTLESTIAADAIFYGVYQTEEVGTTSGTVSVNAIDAVVYNGKKHVSTTSTVKNATPDLDLVVYDYYGSEDDATDHALVEGTDYKVTYKNNVNVGYGKISGKKVTGPQVIIKGIGVHKGLKLTVPFSIVPASFADGSVTMSVKSTYVKINKNGKVNPGVTLKFNGKKLAASNYTVKIYDKDTKKELSQSELKALATGTKVVPLIVRAEAKQTKKNLFLAGSYIDNSDPNGAGDGKDGIDIYGYPANSKKLSVKLGKKSVDYGAGKNKNYVTVDDFVTSDTTIKVKKDVISLSACGLKILAEDKGLNVEATKEYDAGTYYVAVGFDPKTTAGMALMQKYGVYQPTVVKVTYKGVKLKKKQVKLSENKINYTGTKTPLTILTDGITINDLDLDNIKVYSKAGIELDNDNYAVSPKNTKATKTVITFNDADAQYNNSAVGSYKVVVDGRGQYSGSVTLKYTVKKGTVKSLGIKADDIVINNGKAVDFNLQYNNDDGYAPVYAANDDNGKYYVPVTVKKDKATLTQDADGKTGDYQVSLKATKVGTKAGTATITFTNYSGKITKKFDVAAVDFNNRLTVGYEKYGDIEFIPASTVSGAKTIRAYIAQYGGDGEYHAFKLGSDYTLSDLTYDDSKSLGSVTVTPKGTRLTGKATTNNTFPTYAYEVKNLKLTLSDNGYDKAIKAYTLTAEGTTDGVRPTPIVTATVNGKQVTLKGQYDDGSEIKADTDYTYTYTNNTKISTSKEPAYCEINIVGSQYPTYMTLTKSFKIGRNLK